MAISVTHAKTDNIADWTQSDLDAQIALGNFPAGTVLNDIVLPSDWNHVHTVTGLATVATTGDYNDLLNKPIIPGTIVTSVTGSSPISSSGGTTPNITIADAAADGTTKGAVTFTASDFNSSSGLISLDYTNGQKASASLPGYLSSTDWSTFNGKQSAITLTITGTSGAATFIANTLNIPQYQAAGTYVTSVTGTTNRITSSGGTTPAIDISSSYAGQSSIVTTGTLTAGATGAGFTVALGSSTITGKLGLANGGTNADLSATGGTSQFLKQVSTGAAITVGQPAFTDISGTVAAAQLPLATTGAFGAVKPDGTTITVSAGVISAAGGNTTAYAETPSGTINSSNVTFTLANTPANTSGVIVVLDGVVQRNGGGLDYTVSGTTITFVAAPTTGSEMFAYYNTFTANTTAPILLSTTTAIDAKSVANTALYTVPGGKTAVITGAVVRCSAATSITIGPSAGIGNIAGTNNIFASSALTVLTTTTDDFGFMLVGMSKVTAAAGVVYFNLGTAATGTSQTLEVDLIGYLK